MLTEGSGRWEMSTTKGGGNIEFFEDGSAKLDDDGDIEKMSYTINEEQTSLTLVMEDYEDVKSTIKNIKIEDEQTIKGDLFQNDDSESAPIKLVK
jgi:C4-type Zn-finger protein